MKNNRKLLAGIAMMSAVLASGAAGAAQLPAALTIDGGVIFSGNDTGGLVADYAVRVAEARKFRTHVVISGRCQSACTIYTALVPDNLACALPGATLEFHKPRNRDGQWTPALDKLFLGFLSEGVRQHITLHGGLPASGFRVVAAALFVPPCVMSKE
jgi:hypothetical protein